LKSLFSVTVTIVQDRIPVQENVTIVKDNLLFLFLKWDSYTQTCQFCLLWWLLRICWCLDL